jgi:single-strand DNA-binding protein
MARLNKVMMIGRLCDEPKIFTFNNGGKVANIRFAVDNRKKDQQTGQWVDDPCFLDVKAFNRETGRKLADLVEQYLNKGHQAYIEGHLTMEQWEDKNGGGKRSKLVVVMDDVQFLEPRSDGGNSHSDGMSRAPRPAAAPVRQTSNVGSNYNDEPHHEMPNEGGNGGGEGDSIPF